MATTDDIGFVEKHVEKIVAGLTFLVLAFALVRWGLSSPRRIALRRSPHITVTVAEEGCGPEEVERVLNQMSESMADLVKNAHAPVKRVPPWEPIFRRTFEQPFDKKLVASLPNFTDGRLPTGVLGETDRPDVPKFLLTDLRKAIPAPEKPAVINVYDPAMSNREMRVLELKMFGHDAVAMASHYFTFFRARATEHRGPGYWILDAEGKVLEKIGLKAGREHLQKGLARAFDAHHAVDLKTTLEKFASYLDRLERAEDHVAVKKGVVAAGNLWKVKNELKTLLAPPLKKKSPLPSVTGKARRDR